MRYFAPLFVLLLTTVSCDSERKELVPPPLSQAEMWDCYQQQEWDMQSLREELIGRWRWVYSVNYWAPDEGRNTESEELQVHFEDDSTLTVIRRGDVEQTTTWTVVVRDASLFGIDTDKSVGNLRGRILLCDNLIEFNNSYIDGSDNYFVKE